MVLNDSLQAANSPRVIPLPDTNNGESGYYINKNKKVSKWVLEKNVISFMMVLILQSLVQVPL